MRKDIAIAYAFVFAVAMLLPGGVKALTVSPPTFDYSSDPGDSILDVIKLYNESDATLTVYPALQNFTAGGDESGQPKFYPANQDPYGTALAPWISIDATSVTVEPGGRVNLPFSINVPKAAQPGGYYGAILLSIAPPQEAAAVGVASQIGVLLLLKVSGQVREAGNLAEFGLVKPRLWYNHLPVDFFARFENSGTTHLRPSGKLIITDMLGRTAAEIPINAEKKSVLPNSIRRFAFGWTRTSVSDGASELEKEWENFGFGKYKAVLLLNYGAANQAVADEREFAVWPWRILILSVAALVFAIVLFRTKVAGYRRLAVRSHGRNGKK